MPSPYTSRPLPAVKEVTSFCGDECDNWWWPMSSYGGASVDLAWPPRDRVQGPSWLNQPSPLCPRYRAGRRHLELPGVRKVEPACPGGWCHYPQHILPPPTWASFCCCPSEADIQRDIWGKISQVASVCAGFTCSPRHLGVWPTTVLAHGALALATPQPLRRGGWGHPMRSFAHWGPLCSVLGPRLSCCPFAVDRPPAQCSQGLVLCAQAGGPHRENGCWEVLSGRHELSVTEPG